MEPLIYLMSILGCAENDSACQPVAVSPIAYASEAECLRATEAVLIRHSDLQFPSVVAQCDRKGTAPQLLRGSDVLRPEAPNASKTMPRFASNEVGRR